jgi:SAM-dependent methyltransferase
VDGMTQARYDAVADFYVSGFDSTGDPATRALLNLLRPAAGLRVVDVACGHGRITRELARRGAQAVGIVGGKDIAGSWPAQGSYYGEGHWTAREPKSTLRRQVGANHRMLSTYLGTLRRHGLWLDQITEPLPAPGWDQAHDADRKPVFLVARSVKLPPNWR